VPQAVAHHARTTRGLGSTGYLASVREFHETERQKSHAVRVNAMKNQWLMLLKNEDGSNFARDFPFILARETMVLAHRTLFAPRTLVAVPMTAKLVPRTLRKRKAAKRSQVMDAHELRDWLVRDGVEAAAPSVTAREPGLSALSGEER
jgi:hypothetical protein